MAYPKTLFFSGLAIALGPALLRHYLTWPLPGSQDLESLRWVYFLGRFIGWTQLIGAAVAAIGLVGIFRSRPARKTLIWASVVCLVALGLYLVTIRMNAPAIFQPFETVAFARGTSEALPPETLVMGITSGAAAKAYPIRLLAYHHRLDDELDGEPLWVTYCTMCRTGKIFSPMLEGRRLDFDLIGAVRYNSVSRSR